MGLIFKPVRTILILGAAFIAGVFYERNMATDRCLDAGGRVADSGFCEGVK